MSQQKHSIFAQALGITQSRCKKAAANRAQTFRHATKSRPNCAKTESNRAETCTNTITNYRGWDYSLRELPLRFACGRTAIIKRGNFYEPQPVRY